ncbi:MAG: hypothetical protein S4CHLAM123_13730 [Chlamydiales bacterium]|nr:hypothetical protein [Chlamydiales bacterium]
MKDTPKKRKHSDLGIRFLINGCSALLIALFIFVAEYSPLRWIFAAAVAAIAATAVWEYDQLVKKKGLFPAVYLSVVAVILYVFAVFLKTQGPYPFWTSFWPNAPEIVLALAFFGAFIHFAIVGRSPLTHISTTLLGVFYIGIPLALFVRVMYFFTYNRTQSAYFEGSFWIIYMIAVTKAADIGGYFIGSQFGKRKLALKLSPNKTLEGALGGLFTSILMSLFICFLGKSVGHVFEAFSYSLAFWLGLFIGVVGQIGDLAESFLKRDAGVKDSNAIPGVGGILDMVDSLLFTAPVVYIFLRVLYT